MSERLMSAATTTIAPEVQEFLATVRAQLADLDADEQREILDGLEADLTDLVAERGRGALGDPVAYARELRAAAGLEPVMGRVRERRSALMRIHGLLDGIHARWDRAVSALPGHPVEFLDALRPVWWVLRAWIAVEAAALALGQWALTVIPGRNPAGAVAVAVAVVLSVQLGRRRLWPADRWRRLVALRVLLLGLNVLAIVMFPVVLNGLQHQENLEDSRAYAGGYGDAQDSMIEQRGAGVTLNGQPVRNIYPYDAQGHPLTGIQLVDSSGHPLVLTNDPYNEGTGWGDFILVPWLNGKTKQMNVFPLPEQRFDAKTQEGVGAPALQTPPFASLPPVSLAGVTPSLIQVPAP